MNSYRTVIAFTMEEPMTQEDGTITYVNRIKYLPLDYLEARSVKSSAQIITQPMQSGDSISDHMYRNPVTISLSGKFSLNGRNWNNSTYSDIYNEGDRLTAIEYVFEKIKNEGILCTITTVSSNVDTEDQITYDKDGKLIGSLSPTQTRYLTRENMALESISWVEDQNTLKFNFEFKEIIVVDTESYEIDPEDIDLPSLTEPSTQSLGSLLMSTNELPLSISKALQAKGYMEDEWLQQCSTNAANLGAIGTIIVGVAIAAGIAAAAIATTVAIGSAVVTATAAVVPVGTVVAAAVAIVACFAIGIWKIIDNNNRKEKAKKAFKMINNDYHPDLNRYRNFLDDIEATINSTASNISVYQFSSDDEQQICLPIGGQYYYLTVNKMSEWPYFKADIRYNGTAEQGGDPISNMRESWCPVSNFMDLDENVNLWFKDESKKFQIYLVNPNMADEVNPDEPGKINVSKKLSTYYVYISKGSIKENIAKIQSAIENAILAHDFD